MAEPSPQIMNTTDIIPSSNDASSTDMEYVLKKTLPNNQLLVRQVSTGELFLGTILSTTNPLDVQTAKLNALTTNTDGALDALKNLLNHENLVNLQTVFFNRNPFTPDDDEDQNQDEIDQQQEEVENKQVKVVLWDWCDAGTLADFLAENEMTETDLSTRGYGSRGQIARTKERFMPEGMVWTVMLGVLRALMWLHEGRRDVYSVRGPATLTPATAATNTNLSDGANLEQKKKREKAFRDLERNLKKCEKIRNVSEAELDWWPVLHRNLTAKNILLQHPRGIETYGLVKLGGFGKAYVAGGVASRERRGGVVVAPMPPPDGEEAETATEVVREGRKKVLRQGRDKVDKKERPYHAGTEVYHLGRILFRMMTGYELPPGDECPFCGCFHLRTDPPRKKGLLGTLPPPPGTPAPRPPCPHHDCEYDDVNIFAMFLDVGTGYSAPLKSRVVEMLLGLEREVKGAAGNLLAVAWPEYLAWCEYTDEGRLHRDLWDDLWAREVSHAWRTVEEKRATVGEEEWQAAGRVAERKGKKGRKRKAGREQDDEDDYEEWDGSTVRRTERGLEIITLASSEESDEEEDTEPAVIYRSGTGEERRLNL